MYVLYDLSPTITFILLLTLYTSPFPDGSYRIGIEVNDSGENSEDCNEEESESRGRDRRTSPTASDEEDERRPRGRDRFESFDNADIQEPVTTAYVPSSSAGPRAAQAQGHGGQFQQQQVQARHNPTNPSGASGRPPFGQPRGPPYSNYNNNNQYIAHQQGGYPPRGGFQAGANGYPPPSPYPSSQPHQTNQGAGGVYNKFAGRGEPRGPRGMPATRGPPQVNDTATYNPYAMPILPQLQPQYQFAPAPAPAGVPMTDPNLIVGMQPTGLYPQYAPPPIGTYTPQQAFPQEGMYPGYAPHGSVLNVGPDGQPHQQLQQPQTYGYVDNMQYQVKEQIKIKQT